MRSDTARTRGFLFLIVVHVLAVVLLVSGSATAWAVPPAVKIQGFLTDRSGPSPVPANGTHSMLFEIFDASVGGTLLASVGPLSVDVTDGLYEAELPLAAGVFDGTPRHMQITVNGEVLAPRIRMVSVPYAFRSGKADTAATVEPGSVDSNALADDAVTEDKIGVICPNPNDYLVWDGNGWSCAAVSSTVVCPAGGFINCYNGPGGTLGVGICQPGLSYCKPDRSGFDACVGEVLPALETCDGLDNDCDGATDEGGVCASCTDGQTRPCGSSVGECVEGTETCSGGVWGTCLGGVSPQPEMCDGLDNDCDGTTDDGDPGGGAACSTGLFGVCDPGTTTCSGGVLVCQQNQSPSAEVCDGLDNDCDGSVDEGNPGGGGACSTGLAGVCAAGTDTCSGGVLVCQQNQSPAPEVCDGLDNDCDGSVDEGNPGGGGACSTGLPGVCSAGTDTCSGGTLVCQQDQSPAPEVCDGLDNDCDGVVDDGNPGGGVSCSTGLLGICAAGTTTCSGGGLVCQQDKPPSAEICDGLDNDCDGLVDEDGVC